MADIKVIDMTEKTTLEATDEFYLTSDPSGDPVDRVATLANIEAYTSAAALASAAALYPNRNALINGGMRVAQRGASFTSATSPVNSDDTYLFDRWLLLSDGNDIVDVTQVTTPVPDGSYAAACFDIETEDKKWGILQILEAKDSAQFMNKSVSLSFKARMGTSDTSTLLRAGVLAWSSTADAVTSDVVSAWGAEGTNPTLVANWTFENTPGALTALTASYQTFKIEGISIDTASTTNIAVFIWSDDMTNAVGDLVYITDVQLELGSYSTPFEIRPYATELLLCRRYCYVITTVSVTEAVGFGAAASTANVYINIPIDIEMFTTPTPAVTVADWQIDDGINAPSDLTALATDNLGFTSKNNVVLRAGNTGNPFTAYRPYWLVGDGTAGRVLRLDAEL